ncbi:zinc finger BED domain-containing protein DAYSLEEPER [Andrographis paniculata]|uniref:zinc finger BED domain-containing protein DAYSLEEPER n=1 Tax=Andrographis paniculata TaxID=175694 RepID=UPI0021E71D53|nr:zinc finger BED domain-containing protein DAYSLEEPER [Andrographis paniculata]XP_051152219.1 zinc finger BED domain-containing protein DAYSLEEPER [Andrographis paniculata]
MDWGVNSSYNNQSLKVDMDPKSVTVMNSAAIPLINPTDIGLGSTEKGNVILSAKPRKKTMTSVFLKYFEIGNDGKSRRCKFCGQSYSIATATGNLGRHLSNRHPGYDKLGDSSNGPSSQSVTVAKKPHSHAKLPSLDLDHLNWLLIKWVVVSSLPTSTLSEKWLANAFKFLNPAVELWSGEKFQTILREVFRSMQESVRLIVEQISSKVSITLDFWTSYEQILYMSITCQWIDENWSFQKVLLDICHIPSPCGGTEIYHALLKVLRLYNLENKILSCTHDNSSNALQACLALKSGMDGQKMAAFCHIPCAAQTLNSIINDGLRTTKSVIVKIREFVLKLNSSQEMSEDFVQFTAAYQEGSWKFPLDASARWSGSYQMLDLARKAGKSMETVIRKYEEQLGSQLLLNSAEKNVVTIMHKYLEPFYKTINNICTNRVLTIGLVLFFMDHISEMIMACKDYRQSPDWLKSSAEDMYVKAQAYSDQLCNAFTYMTAILDPRIKVELIPEYLNTESNLEEARSHFIRNYSTSYFSPVTNPYTVQESEDGGSASFAEEIARKKRRATMNSATDELTQYLSEPPAPMPTDVLDWWKVNSSRYPRLSLMARDFLAVQSTAVLPEDIFCSKGDEVDRQRFSTPVSCTQAIFCVKSWMQNGMKMKYKSTEIDYARMMEMAAAESSRSFDKKQK